MRIKDLIHGGIIQKTQMNLSELGFALRNNDLQIFKKGSIVWSKSGTVGKTSILGINVTANRGILNILPNNKIKNKYLYYWLIKNRKKLQNKAAGSVLKHLYSFMLMKEKISLPDLEEQAEIVAIIEENENLFLQNNNCVKINSVNDVKKDMKELIEKIEPLEKQINNVYNIIQSIEKRAMLMQKLYDSNVLISDITTKYKKGYSYKRTDFQEIGKYKVFTIKNIKSETKFSYTNVIKNNILQSGDVVTGLDGTIGTTKIISSLDWAFSNHVFSITSKYFLEIWASIKINASKLMRQTTGSVILNIAYKNILNLKTSTQGYDEKISQLYLKALELVKNFENLKALAIKLLIKN